MKLKIPIFLIDTWATVWFDEFVLDFGTDTRLKNYNIVFVYIYRKTK